MAGVAENNGLELEPLVNGQHGHIVVEGAFQGGTFGSELGDLTLTVFAAIHTKAADAVAVLEDHWLQFFERLAGDAHDLVFETRGILLNPLDARVVERINVVQSAA